MSSTDLVTAVTLAVAIGGGAFIVSRAKIAQPLRQWLFKQKTRGWAWAKLYELAGCPFCLSVWMAGVACLLYHVQLVHGYGPLDWLVSTLAVSAASMLPVHIIGLAVAPSMMPPQVLRKEDAHR